MNFNRLLAVAVLIVSGVWAQTAQSANAAGEERKTFGKWHFGVGAAFNSSVKARLGTTMALPVPAMYAIPEDLSYDAADAAANDYRFDGGGYIADDGRNGEFTENWKLPSSAYQGDGVFVLDNAYQAIDPKESTFDNEYRDSSDRELQYGVAAELARELWIRDEAEEHRRGVDFAAAFSFFFKRDVYKARGTVKRTDRVHNNAVRTKVNDPDAMADYDGGADWPDADDMYGHGNEHYDLDSPALGWRVPGTITRLPDAKDVNPVSEQVSQYGYRASGDYRELEMLFMFRPWYEIKDWWRVYAQVGVGVSWGHFDSRFAGGGVACKEDFSQWDCYGVAGLGTAFRYDEWTLGIDFLGRFLRDDFEVDGKYVEGEIRRADWGFRVMLGYEF